MKIIFLGMFLLIISCAQAISKEDFVETFTSADKSLIESNEQGHELNGNSYGNSNIQVSTRLNHKNVIVASKNEHKHELFVTTRYSTGGGGARGGGGGMGGGTSGGSARAGGVVGGGTSGGSARAGGVVGGAASGGSARAGGVVGGAATGMIGGRAIYAGDINERNNYSYNFATTLSTGTHICVSILILYVNFWI
ncbi:unnamed protein product [Lathyrus oleraceus]